MQGSIVKPADNRCLWPGTDTCRPEWFVSKLPDYQLVQNSIKVPQKCPKFKLMEIFDAIMQSFWVPSHHSYWWKPNFLIACHKYIYLPSRTVYDLALHRNSELIDTMKPLWIIHVQYERQKECLQLRNAATQPPMEQLQQKNSQAPQTHLAWLNS